MSENNATTTTTTTDNKRIRYSQRTIYRPIICILAWCG